MASVAHDVGDTAKLVVVAIAIVILAVIVLAFVFQTYHISFLGLNLVNTILSLPEAIINFFTNGINSISAFLIHLLHNL